MCNTVGELREELKKFEPNTPLDLTAFCYADGDKWVQISRNMWKNDPGYDKPLNIVVEEHTYDGKTTFCRLSAESVQMMKYERVLVDDD